MYELKNINKTYEINKSNKLEALKEINIKLPNKGLIVILGESGSGKTTLMNLLGGLDLPTSGEIWFNNECLNQEKSQSKILKKLDEYKRNNISFIFQDFNLINKLNIEDNLKLGLTFNGSEEKISEVLEEVGLKGYEKRYPKDISGGEHQRVAIARGLLKKAKVILADEPTGNLDKKNGEEIIKILKNISKEKLVIIVSHNEELVKPYSDGIIRLEDGKIIEQKINTTEEEINIEETENKKTISNKVAFKLAFHNLGVRKARLILTFLILTICYAILGLAITINLYKHIDPHYQLIKDMDYQVFQMTNVDYYAYKYMEKKGVSTTAMIQSSDDLLKMGFNLYPTEVNFEEGCIYASDIYIWNLISMNESAIINDVNVTLDPKKHKIEDLIGQKIFIDEDIVTLSGVYYNNNHSIQPSYDDEIPPKGYENYFYTTEYFSYSTYLQNGTESQTDFKTHIAINDEVAITNYVRMCKLNGERNLYITERGILDGDKEPVELADNEVYISFKLYCDLFNTKYDPISVIKKVNNSYSLETQLDNFGTKITYGVENKNKIATNLGEYIIKGVVINKSECVLNYIDLEDSEIIFNDKIYPNNSQYLDYYTMWVKTSSIKNLHEFLKIMNEEQNADFFTPVSNKQADFESQYNGMKIYMRIVEVGMLLVISLIITIMISINIYDRKKEIGILKSLGSFDQEIFKIFLFEILILLILVALFSTILLVLVVKGFNFLFVYETYHIFKIITIKGIVIIINLLLVFVILVLASIIPLKLITKTTTINTIRN